jgi:hypothetical protein
MKLILLSAFLFAAITSCNNAGDNKNSYGEVTMLTSPAGDSCAEPHLFTDADGRILLSWIEKAGKESKLLFATFSENKWSAPSTIASGNNWFVNWADYPSVTAGSKGLIAHYLEKSDSGKYTYDIKIKTSPDAGTTWQAPKLLNEDAVAAEHGFVSIIPYGENYFASWLDGRNTAPMHEMDHEGHKGAMTLRGAILSADGTKVDEWELDNRVCDCCQTTAALTANGPVVIYRDRTEKEVRDMSIVRLLDGKWTAPKIIYPDNWEIAGCPVNGPRADAIGNHLAIGWYTMKDNKGEVKIIFSGDGGSTFSKPIQVSEGNTVGRVDIVMLDKETALVSWMEGADLKVNKVKTNGAKDKAVLISTSSEERSSGFPQMSRAGDSVIFAWTDSKAKKIRVASLKW